MHFPALESLKVLDKKKKERVEVLGRIFGIGEPNAILGVRETSADGLVEEEDVGLAIPRIRIPNSLIGRLWVDGAWAYFPILQSEYSGPKPSTTGR